MNYAFVLINMQIIIVNKILQAIGIKSLDRIALGRRPPYDELEIAQNITFAAFVAVCYRGAYFCYRRRRKRRSNDRIPDQVKCTFTLSHFCHPITVITPISGIITDSSINPTATAIMITIVASNLATAF